LLVEKRILLGEKYIDKMKKFIESYNGDLVEHSIDYLTGKQLRLI